MAGQDTVNFDAAMKTVYADGIAELIPNKFPLLEMFEERDSKEFGGRYVEQSVHVGRNTGVGAYSEMGAIPAAGQQQYTTKRIPMRFMAGRIQLSAQVMRMSQGSRSAFEPAMESEMRRLANDMRNEFARILHSDGRGVLAFVNGDPGTGTTVTADAPGGVAGATNGSRFINPTMLVTFVNPATGALRATSIEETVVSVPAAGTTFTTGSAVDTNIADNDYIVRANKTACTDVSDTNYAKEPMGLRGLNDDGTYVATLHGINRTSYPNWQNAVIGSVGALSADVLQRGIDLADQRGGGSIDKIVWHPSVRRTYITLSDNGRRYQGSDLSRPDVGTVAAKGGEMSFGGIRTLTSKYADYGIVHLLDTSTLSRWVEVKGEWADDDGSVLKQLGTGSTLQDGYEAYYRSWWNTDCDAPNKNARLDGVVASIAVVHAD